MEFQKLASLYEELEATSSGNKMREVLGEFFAKVPKEDIAIVAYLTLGRIGSDYEAIVLGMAEKSVLKALAQAAGQEQTKVNKIMQETGDAGLTAEKVLHKKPQTLVPLGRLMVREVYDKLHKIAEAGGTGSQEKKAQLLISLLQKATPRGARYVVRILLGTLRMGVGDMTVLDALSLAYTGSKEGKEKLEQAYNICPDVGIIAETLAKEGLKGIEKIEVHVGRPIKMMLAQRVEVLEEVAVKIPGKVVVEGKYDGERIQVHKSKDGIQLFSRRLENITAQFPDLAEQLQKQVQAKELVLEGEVIAVDKDGKPLPFQLLMQRRRKYGVEEYAQKIPVQLKLFDLLYCTGKSFLKESWERRNAKLQDVVKKNKQITFADRIISSQLEEINSFFQEMLEQGYEGIMIKSPQGEYQAGMRGWNWIKWKREYVKEMHDTFDVVVVGAYHGKGKRSGKYGALLCAVYNEKNDMFETLCKLGTGLTDEVLKTLPGQLKKYQLTHQPARLLIKKEMEPEVWFEPAVVVEVLGAELTKSPFHTAANGVALRFPRFIKFREDKKAEQATTTREIEQMFIK